MSTFSQSQKKLQLLWEQVQKGEIEIEKLKRISVDFNSNTYNKVIYRTKLLEDHLLVNEAGEGEGG